MIRKMMPTTIRPRDIQLEAMRWKPNSRADAEALLRWVESNGGSPGTETWSDGSIVAVLDVENDGPCAKPDQWVVRGVTGVFFPVSDENYQINYVEVA